MAITFHIYFFGLTLFFTEDDLVHAFMPSTGDNSFRHVPNHTCTLYVPKQYRTPGVPASVKLDDRHLLLESGGGDSADLLTELQAHMPNLSEITKDPLPGDLLTSDARGTLRTRVTAPAGRLFFTEVGDEFRWRDGELKEIPYISGVEIANVDDEPELTILSLDDQTTYDRYTLQPDDSGLIEIGISHIPKNTPMDDPIPGEPSPHFIALYGLYESPAEILIPRFDHEVRPGGSLPSVFGRVSIFGDPFTCVHGFGAP